MHVTKKNRVPGGKIHPRKNPGKRFPDYRKGFNRENRATERKTVVTQAKVPSPRRNFSEKVETSTGQGQSFRAARGMTDETPGMVAMETFQPLPHPDTTSFLFPVRSAADDRAGNMTRTKLQTTGDNTLARRQCIHKY
ncbi:hypothetical protein RUM44_008095 [Polyplax serrata]|uniref:Uncharacterized protein n=1 Tax=Polyplax serrata TaxID=468196 RepID=A0ABR1B7N5_POLSC